MRRLASGDEQTQVRSVDSAKGSWPWITSKVLEGSKWQGPFPKTAARMSLVSDRFGRRGNPSSAWTCMCGFAHLALAIAR